MDKPTRTIRFPRRLRLHPSGVSYEQVHDVPGSIRVWLQGQAVPQPGGKLRPGRFQRVLLSNS